MKTTTALPIQALSSKPRVKIYLIMGIIYITSEKFSIFASIAAALMEYVGVLSDNYRLVAFGALVFLAGFLPWGVRDTARYFRQDKIGLK